MARLVWDQVGERLYETGTKNGVLYVQNLDGSYGTGVAWNGLTAFTDSRDGGDASDYYADNMKYLSLRAAENVTGTIEAYTYPDEFAVCDGSASPVAGVTIMQQVRKPFAFCYRTEVGNDTAFEDYGYKLHIIYGATCSPSERSYQTINDSPEPITFSWEITTVPVSVTFGGVEYRPTAEIVIDSTKVASATMKAIEDVLYGAANGADAAVLMPSEIMAMISGTATTYTLSYTASPNNIGATVPADSQVLAGEFINLNSAGVVAPSGYHIASFTSSDVTIGGGNVFVMPEDDVAVTVTFEANA